MAYYTKRTPKRYGRKRNNKRKTKRIPRTKRSTNLVNYGRRLRQVKGSNLAYTAATAGAALIGSQLGMQYRNYRMRNRYVNNLANSMTKTLTLNNSDDNPVGIGNEWSKANYRFKLGKVTTNKLLQGIIDSSIDRWQSIRQFSGYGSLFFSRQVDSPAAGFVKQPVFLMDLTCMNNVVDDTGALYYPQNMWELYNAYAGGTTGQYGWIQRAGQISSTGGAGATYATAGWQYEKTPGGGSVLKAPHANAILKWVDIRMNMWGTLNQPVKILAQIVQLPTYAQPKDTFNTGGTAVTPAAGVPCSDDGISGNDLGSIAFWNDLLDPQVFNPISSIGRKQVAGLKVLRTVEVQFDPKTSIETESDPHAKTVKLFLKLGRKLNFAWQDSTYSLNANNVNNVTPEWEASIGANNCYVHPKARVYLLLRAYCYTAGTTTTPTNASYPSVDLIVRRKIIHNV